MLENLLTQSNRFSDLAEGIATTGFFFGKKKKEKYINAWKVIETEVAFDIFQLNTDVPPGETVAGVALNQLITGAVTVCGNAPASLTTTWAVALELPE